MRGTAAGALALVGLLLTACGGGGLSDVDPRGYAACQKLDGSRADGKVDLDENVALGITASEATTQDIRESAKATFTDDQMAQMRAANPKVEQIYLVNQDKLRTACAAAGYQFKS